jgi:hypothetical protein
MTCHQAHNIPWSILEECIIPAKDDENSWEPKHENEAQTKKLQHFISKFASAIEEFSTTARKRYPDTIRQEKVFSDDLVDEEFLLKRYQQLSYWKERAQDGYSSSDMDLTSVIKMLFNKEEITSILYLAQQKDAKLPKLSRITYSNFFHFGIARIYQDALQMYLVINVCLAKSRIGTSTRPRPRQLSNIVHEVMSGQDGDVNHLPHRAFLRGNEDLHDVTELKKYLEFLWRCIYLYDMILKEAGEPINWREDIFYCLKGVFGSDILPYQ